MSPELLCDWLTCKWNEKQEKEKFDTDELGKCLFEGTLRLRVPIACEDEECKEQLLACAEYDPGPRWQNVSYGWKLQGDVDSPVTIMTEIICPWTKCPQNRNGKHTDPPVQIKLELDENGQVQCNFFKNWLSEQLSIYLKAKEAEVAEVEVEPDSEEEE